MAGAFLAAAFFLAGAFLAVAAFFAGAAAFFAGEAVRVGIDCTDRATTERRFSICSMSLRIMAICARSSRSRFSSSRSLAA